MNTRTRNFAHALMRAGRDRYAIPWRPGESKKKIRRYLKNADFDLEVIREPLPLNPRRHVLRFAARTTRKD